MEFVVEIECFHKVFFKNAPHIQSAVRTVRSAVRTFCADRSILDPSLSPIKLINKNIKFKNQQANT